MGMKRAALPFAALALVTLGGCQRSSNSEALVFGHPVPQTGPDQAAGLLEFQAVRLAVKEANDAGGRRVTVLHADTADRPDAFLTQATRLLAVNRVAGLIGGSTVEQLRQMATPALVEQAVLVSPSGGPGALLNRAVFTVGLAPADQGKALARFAAEELRATSAAVVSDAARPVALAFAKEFRQGERTVREEATYRDAKELPDLARRLADGKPGVVLFAGPARDLPAFRDALPKEGPPALLFAGEEPDLTALLGAPGPGRDLFAATAFRPDDPFPRVQEFARRFREQTGQAPTAGAALAHDAARALIEATRRAGTAKPAAWRDELARLTDFEALTGPLTFTADQSARRPVLIVQLRGGQGEIRQRYEPDRPAQPPAP
jgi:branched-chain amino acid transport system substrate-binding protein